MNNAAAIDSLSEMANMSIEDLYERLTEIKSDLDFATGEEKKQLLQDNQYYYDELRSRGHRAIFTVANREYCKKVQYLDLHLQSLDDARDISRKKILTEVHIGGAQTMIFITEEADPNKETIKSELIEFANQRTDIIQWRALSNQRRLEITLV